MWELTVNLRDGAEAQQFLTEIGGRPEAGSPLIRVITYPDDGMAVARTTERSLVAGLATWALTFTTSRIGLRDDSGAYQEG